MASRRSSSATLQSDREDYVLIYSPPSWAHKEWEQYYNYPSLSQPSAPGHGLGESHFATLSSPTLGLKRQHHTAQENTSREPHSENAHSRGSDTRQFHTFTLPSPADHPWQRSSGEDTTTPRSLATIHSLIGSSRQASPAPSILSSLGNEGSVYYNPTAGVSSPIGDSFLFPQQVALPGGSSLRKSRQQYRGSTNRPSSFSEEESCLSPLSPTARYHVDSATLFGDFDSPQTPRSQQTSRDARKDAGRPPLPPGARQKSLTEPRTSFFTQPLPGGSKLGPRGRNVSDSESSCNMNSSYFKDTPKHETMKGDSMPKVKNPLHRTKSQQLALPTLGEESEYSSPESPSANFRAPSPRPGRQQPFTIVEESDYTSPESPPANFRTPFEESDQTPQRLVRTQRPLSKWSSSSNLNDIDDSTTYRSISPMYPDFTPGGLSPSPPTAKRMPFSSTDSLSPRSSQLSPEPSSPIAPAFSRDAIKQKSMKRLIPLMKGPGLGDAEFWRHIKSDAATCSADTSFDDANVSFSQAGKTSRKMPKMSSGLQSISESAELRSGPRAPPTRSIDTVTSLTSSTFQNFIKQQTMAVIMFYSSATGGPATPDTFSSYSIAGARGAKPAFASVDCAQEADLCARENVPSYPFYKLYSGGHLLNAVKDFGVLNNG